MASGVLLIGMLLLMLVWWKREHGVQRSEMGGGTKRERGTKEDGRAHIGTWGFVGATSEYRNREKGQRCIAHPQLFMLKRDGDSNTRAPIQVQQLFTAGAMAGTQDSFTLVGGEASVTGGSTGSPHSTLTMQEGEER